MVPQGPIVFLSVFKSGTHALRYMLEQLTGMPYFEPEIVRGRTDYRDPSQLRFVPGRFYSWHLIPNEEACARMRDADARPVFLLRDPADLAVSMYHHFADDIDADIGRGRGVQHHFSSISKRDGLMAIIEGLERVDFRWPGIGPHLRHMSRLLEFAGSYPSFVTTFEQITGPAKRTELERLARFLGVTKTPEQLDALTDGSTFARMRARAAAHGRSSHYRRGASGGHRGVLDEAHYAALSRQEGLWAPQLRDQLRDAGLGFDVPARRARACY